MFRKIPLKTTAEIQTMREGGKILATILQEVKAYAQVGMTTGDLNKYAEDRFQHYNVIPSFKGYNGFPAAITTAVNDEVVHGIPGNQLLQEGDIITIDAGVFYKGLHTDSATSFGFGSISKAAQKLIKETKNALYKGIDTIKSGSRVGDIGYAIETHLKQHGIKVYSDLTGHGVGRKLHEPPYVPNEGKPGQGDILKPGMTLAIEPITSLGNAKMKTLADNWTIVSTDGSLAAQEEHTIVVTETGCEILTRV